MSPDSQRWDYFELVERLLGLLESGELTPAQLAVLMLLSRYADYSTGENARAGVETLARRLRLGQSTVSRALARGIELVVIEQVRRGGGSGERARASTYRFLPPNTDEQCATRLAGGWSSARPTPLAGESSRATPLASPLASERQPGVPGEELQAKSSTIEYQRGCVNGVSHLPADSVCSAPRAFKIKKHGDDGTDQGQPEQPGWEWPDFEDSDPDERGPVWMYDDAPIEPCATVDASRDHHHVDDAVLPTDAGGTPTDRGQRKPRPLHQIRLAVRRATGDPDQFDRALRALRADPTVREPYAKVLWMARNRDGTARDDNGLREAFREFGALDRRGIYLNSRDGDPALSAADWLLEYLRQRLSWRDPPTFDDLIVSLACDQQERPSALLRRYRRAEPDRDAVSTHLRAMTNDGLLAPDGLQLTRAGVTAAHRAHAPWYYGTFNRMRQVDYRDLARYTFDLVPVPEGERWRDAADFETWVESVPEFELDRERQIVNIKSA